MILIKHLHKDKHKLVDNRVAPDNEGLPGVVRRIKRMAAEDEQISFTYKQKPAVGSIEWKKMGWGPEKEESGM